MKYKRIMYVRVIWGDSESIRKAENLKARLENRGYTLIHTTEG